MKKILLATTMLVGTAGFAAAEVTLSGDARMGIVHDDDNANDTMFDSRVRATVSMSGETDGGLSFAGSFGIHNAGDAASGTSGSVSISGAFGTLAMGDVDGAAKGAVGNVSGVGYVGVGDLNELTFVGGGDKESVLYTYSAGALTVMASIDQIDEDDTYAIGASYAAEGVTVSFGYESNSAFNAGTELAPVIIDVQHVLLGVSATVSGIGLKAVYGSASGDVDLDQYALSATYTADALSATVFHRSSLFDVSANGIGVGYDLGGGASFAAGYAKAEDGDAHWDAGVNFSF